jgi:adenosine deaminase
VKRLDPRASGARCGRSVEDPELLAYLADQQVPLDVCPTSNLRLGVYRSFAEHPLRQLIEAGAMVTVSTDTPAVFGITLTEEVGLLGSEFGLAAETVKQVLLNGFRASFMPPESRADVLRVPSGDT